MATLTPNLGLSKPVVGADDDVWGSFLNGNADILDSAILTKTQAATTYAPINSPALTGNPTAPTPTVGDNDTSIATTAFVAAAVTAGGGGGISDAPSDGSTYGRLNAAWNKALPLTGGTLSGGLTISSGNIVLSSGSLTSASAGINVLSTITNTFTMSGAAFNSTYTGSVFNFYRPNVAGQKAFAFQVSGAAGTPLDTFAVYSLAASFSGALAVTGNTTLTTATATTPAVGNNSTSIATTAFVAAAAAPALNNVGRNMIHNPLFNIWQRGASFNANSVYTADRWLLLFNLDTGVAVAQTALTDAIRAAIGDEAAATALQTAFTGNAGAASYTFVTHSIENVRLLSGKTVTVSFWAWSAAGTPKVGVSLDQGFGSGGSPSATVTGNGQAVTLSTTATRYSLTFAVPSASGKTLGTAGDSKTSLVIWLSSGTTQATRAGSIGVQAGTIALWGVQLEIGSVMTPLEKPDLQQDLAKCQRYYSTGVSDFNGYGTTGGVASTFNTFPVQMRAAPTVVYGAPTYGNASGITAVTYASGMKTYVIVTATGSVSCTATYTASADL